MDNVGASAWEVPSADEKYVGTSGGDNPTITLETGVRYTISNEGWSTHPLALRDESGSILLSQSTIGEFENDGDVNWSDSGSTLSFTLTDELANRISSYICTVHSNMVGQIETTESDTSEVALSGSTITIDTGGSAAVGVDDLPDDVSVSEISDGGGQPPSNQDGIVWQSAAGLPSTVSFTLTPGSNYAAGDTITFTAAGTERTLTVVESSTPAEIADTVSNKQYNAWAGSDSKIDQQEAINGFNGWFNKGSHNGESLDQQEALDLFNYWFNNG
jgi:plastocyanin